MRAKMGFYHVNFLLSIKKIVVYEKISYLYGIVSSLLLSLTKMSKSDN